MILNNLSRSLVMRIGVSKQQDVVLIEVVNISTMSLYFNNILTLQSSFLSGNSVGITCGCNLFSKSLRNIFFLKCLPHNFWIKN